MPKFDKSNVQELKNFLYYSCVHDAKLESVHYEYENNNLKIDIFHPVTNTKVSCIFCNVQTILALRGQWTGSREAILSLSVENDSSRLKNYIQKHGNVLDNYIYMLFQMFSGDELHIVSETVTIVEERYGANTCF